METLFTRIAVFTLVLVACHPKPTAGDPDTEAGTMTAAARIEDAAVPKKASGFSNGPAITLQIEKRPAAMDFLGRGSWAAFGPNGVRAIVGSPGRATVMPGDKPLAVKDPSNAAFAPDGRHFFVVHAGKNAVTNEVTIHADDLHIIVKLENALDPKWISAEELSFDRDGKVYRVGAADNASAKAVGPEKPAFTARPRTTIISDDGAAWLIVDQDELRRPTGVRRIRLATGIETTLIGKETAALFNSSKPGAAEPVVAVAPDLSRACIVGPIHTGISIWCGADGEPAEEVADLTETSKAFGGSFLSPTKLSFKRAAGGTVGIVDFATHQISILTIPGGTQTTDMTALPGSKLAVARDFFRVGIVDLEARRFVPIGDETASPSSAAGIGTDDSVFAVAGSSLVTGPGVFRVKTR